MAFDLKQFCQFSWKEVYKKVKKAVVFIDNTAAECLHWNGDIVKLLLEGAVAVKEFSSFESGNNSQKKAVFITSSVLTNEVKTVLRDIIQNSSFEYCVLVTSVHPYVHRFVKHHGSVEGNESSVFYSLQTEILQWMGNEDFTVEILHFPLFLIAVTDYVFLTPPFHDVSIFEEEFKNQSAHNYKESKPQLQDLSVPFEVQIQQLYLSTCLHSIFIYLDTPFDVYSLGPCSSSVANYLEKILVSDSLGKFQNASSKCSLILVDRSMDLSSASSYNSECLLDKILSILPNLPGHSSDIAADMSQVANAKVSNVTEDISLAPGCLSHPEIEICNEILEWLFKKKQKDVLQGLYQHLLSVAPSEQKVMKIPTRITPHALEKLVSSFKGKPDLLFEHSGLLEQTLAVTQTLKSPRLAELEVILSIEKLLLQSLGSSKNGVGILNQVIGLIKTRKTRGLQLEDLFSLLVHLYSLVGTEYNFPASEEINLEETLKDVLVEEKQQLEVPLMSEDMACTAAKNIILQLHTIAQQRRSLVKYKSLIHYGDSKQPTEYTSLLSQVMQDLANPAKPDIPDLTCKSAGLKDLLKSSFSMFLKMPRQNHPMDNPRVILFVIGGITAKEVKSIHEAYPDPSNILIGSTSFITPKKLVQKLFLSNIQNSL